MKLDKITSNIKVKVSYLFLHFCSLADFLGLVSIPVFCVPCVDIHARTHTYTQTHTAAKKDTHKVREGKIER